MPPVSKAANEMNWIWLAC